MEMRFNRLRTDQMDTSRIRNDIAFVRFR